MRVLTVIAELGSGGAESIVVQLASRAAARGDDVVVATEGGWRVDDLAALGVDVLVLPLRTPGPLGLLRSVARVRRRLSQRPVDVVHAHNIRATVVARLGSQRVGRPRVVSTVHGLASERYRPAARALRLLADEVVAVSDDVAARLRAGGFPQERLRVIENAPPPIVPLGRAESRRDLGIAREIPVVLCLARLARPKRHDLLLAAWAEVTTPALLIVAGDGPERRSLERQAAGLALDDRVRFLGDRRDVGRLLSASDVLVLPSDREGLPLTVLEAMSLGVPVVASDVGGLRSLDPAVLCLVSPGSSASLASALSQTLADPEGRLAMAGRAQALIAERYSTSAMDAAYRRLFETTFPPRP